MLASKEELELSLKIFEGEFLPYYKSLDREVAETDRYVSIRMENSSAFSLEYSKLLQAICGEIDVFAKAICNLNDSNVKPDDLNIKSWGIRIQAMFPRIESTNVFNPGYGVISPWQNWRYVYSPDINGRNRIKLADGKKSLPWWGDYNKVKHERMNLRSTESSNYKKANQSNIVNALAALNILENLYLAEVGSSLFIESELFSDMRP